jgi:ethanolaminephosphotransferase
MTSTRCQIFNWALVPLTLVVALFSYGHGHATVGPYLTAANEVYALYIMCLLVTISHVHYGVCTVRQICKHLNIYCFVITSKPSGEKKNN